MGEEDEKDYIRNYAFIHFIVWKCLRRSKTEQVDLIDYIDVSFSGVSTEGVADYTIDIDQAIVDVYGWELSEFDEEMDYLYVKKPEIAEEIEQLYDSYEVSFDPANDLENNDIVTVRVSVGEDYTYAFANGEKELTVSGLEELDVLTEEEVEKHIVVDFVGANERGFSRVNNTFNNEFSSVEFMIENDGNLSNGDQAKLMIGEDNTLREMGYRLETDFDVTFEVEGLAIYPKSVKDIKNLKDVERLLEEDMEKNYPKKRNYDFETRFKYKEEATLYRQFHEDDYDRHTDTGYYGTYIKLYTIERYNDKTALDEKDPSRVYVYARGFRNLHVDEEGNVNLAELDTFYENHDESYSLDTVKQLYEGHGYELIK